MLEDSDLGNLPTPALVTLAVSLVASGCAEIARMSTGRRPMLRVIVTTLAIAAGMAIAVDEASASCPAGTKYQCHQTFNGKMQCGCY